MVAVVNLKTRKVTSRWPVAPGGQPVAMAMDMPNHRLFIGCRNPQKLIVMNSETGTIEASVPIGAGVDAGRFDGGLGFRQRRRWLADGGSTEKRHVVCGANS